MTCGDCEVAAYIAEEASNFPGDKAVILALARYWHGKCVNWLGRNRRGCDCKHVV